jgi:hypothetical protein
VACHFILADLAGICKMTGGEMPQHTADLRIDQAGRTADAVAFRQESQDLNALFGLEVVRHWIRPSG